MKAKYDLIKMAGWIAVAIGGLAASWATDKQSKEEIDKKLARLSFSMMLMPVTKLMMSQI